MVITWGWFMALGEFHIKPMAITLEGSPLANQGVSWSRVTWNLSRAPCRPFWPGSGFGADFFLFEDVGLIKIPRVRPNFKGHQPPVQLFERKRTLSWLSLIQKQQHDQPQNQSTIMAHVMAHVMACQPQAASSELKAKSSAPSEKKTQWDLPWKTTWKTTWKIMKKTNWKNNLWQSLVYFGIHFSQA